LIGGIEGEPRESFDISVFKKTISPPLGLNLESISHPLWKLFSIISQNGGQRGSLSMPKSLPGGAV